MKRALLWIIAGEMAFSLSATDWVHYRGPRHDGSTPDAIRVNWSESTPKILWKKPLGNGWSSISVANRRVYTQVKRSGGETVVALNAATGDEIWATAVGPADYNQSLSGAAPDADDGPRTTPAVQGDKVYVITSLLQVHCLRASDGGVVWTRDFVAEAGPNIVLSWSHCGSPLVVGDLLYLNSNVSPQRLTALRVSDGTTAWATQNDGATHSTPTYVNLGGVPQIMFLTSNGLIGLLPDSGAVQWRYDFSVRPSTTSTAATPLAIGDVVYASCAYSRGAWTAEIRGNSGQFTVENTKFQQSSQYQNHWATPVAHGDYLYGIVETSGRSMACYDIKARANNWTTSTVGSGRPGYASLIRAGEHLVVLTERGELVVVKPNPERYEELGRLSVLGSHCWNQPTVVDGIIYARSSKEIVAVDAATAASVPLVPFGLKVRVGGPTGLEILAQSLGGRLLDAGDAPRILLEASDALATGWQPVEATWRVTDGGLIAELPTPNDARFYRGREKTSNP